MVTLRRIAALIVMSRDAQGLFALLQKRGEWDYEKRQPESYPGGCQATASGGMEEEDDGDPEATMRREVWQELGGTFASLVISAKPEFLASIPMPNMNRRATFYWVEMPEEDLAKIALHPSSGGLVRFRQGMEMRDMYAEFSRAEGITDRRVIAAYPELKLALARAFVVATKP